MEHKKNIKKSLNPTHRSAKVYWVGDVEIPLPEYDIHDSYSDGLVHGEEHSRPRDPASRLNTGPDSWYRFFAFRCHYHRWTREALQWYFFVITDVCKVVFVTHVWLPHVWNRGIENQSIRIWVAPFL